MNDGLNDIVSIGLPEFFHKFAKVSFDSRFALGIEHCLYGRVFPHRDESTSDDVGLARGVATLHLGGDEFLKIGREGYGNGGHRLGHYGYDFII